ncbi:MAG: hypothetical protein ACHQ53_18505, partial [Polyangiales bacterium]
MLSRTVRATRCLLLSASSLLALCACGGQAASSHDAGKSGQSDAAHVAGHGGNGAAGGSARDAASPGADAGSDNTRMDASTAADASDMDAARDAAGDARLDAAMDTGAADGGPDSSSDGAMADASPPHTLSSITVAPLNPLVQLDLSQPGTQPFTATGHYLDGMSDDLTAQVQWTVANANVGAITASTLTIPAFSSTKAEVSKITASLDGIDGVAQITVVAYASSGPKPARLLVLPYQDSAGNQTTALDFATAIPALDVFFLVDATGSMAGEISNLQSSLSSTVLPGISAAVTDAQFGVGALEDFPVDGYGSLHGSDCGGAGESAADQPFKLKQAITSSSSATQTGVNALSTGSSAPIGCGGDWPEAGLEALYQVATGEGLSGPSPTSVPAN